MRYIYMRYIYVYEYVYVCICIYTYTYTYTRAHDAVRFKMELAKSKTFERSIYYKGAKEWNSLDSSTRNIPTSLDFKRNQKNWLRSTIH